MSRSLAEIARAEAPLRPRRAAAVILTIIEHLGDIERTQDPDNDIAAPPASEVVLHADGRVEMPVETSDSAADDARSDLGAALGRWYHLLLVGREPLASADGFEPHLRAALGDEQCALIARSASPAPGQWPSVAEWAALLGPYCGGQRAETAPHLERRRQRSRMAARVLLALVIAATIAVLVMAPRWWNDATGAQQGATVPAFSASEVQAPDVQAHVQVRDVQASGPEDAPRAMS